MLAPGKLRIGAHVQVAHPAVVPGNLHAQRRWRAVGRIAALAELDAPIEAAAAVPVAVEPVAAPTAAPAISMPTELPDLPDLSAASEQAAKTVQGLTGSVTGVAAGVTDKAAELASAANQATSQVTGAASKAAADLTAAVSGVTGGVTSKVSNLTSSLGEGASGVAGQVSGTLSSTLSTVKGGLTTVKGNLDQATAGVTELVGDTLETVSATTQTVTSAVGETISSGQAAVQQSFNAVNAQVSAVTSQVTSAVGATTQQVLDQLPPEVKDAAVAVGGAVGAGVSAAAHTAVEHPRVAAAVTAAVAIPTAIRYYKGRYGGYAGELSPDQVSGLLAEEGNVFLIDIRPEEVREEEGLPQVKLAARFKVAAYNMQTNLLPPRVAREAVNADELRLLINAAYIAGLPQCQGNLTKLIVMDSSGSDKARDLARALVTLGYGLSYVLEGGFQGWVDAELPIVEGASEYDASTGAVIGDELEVLANKATEVATTVAQPSVGLPLLGGSVLLTYAAVNYHTTLKFVGVLGVLLTVVNKLLSYESPKAAYEDITGTLGGVAQKVGSLKLPRLPARGGGAAAVPAGVAMAAAADAEEGEVEEEVEEVLEQQPQQ